MSRPFTSLPGEVIEEILRHLDYRALLRCCSVCQFLKTMVENSSEFQYIIELGGDGMVDSSPIGTPHALRLAELRSRREAWNSLTWKTRSVISIQGLCHAYELVGGLFVKATGGQDFLLSWLPSAGHKERQLFRHDLGLQARDFAIDPAQNLIIFVEDDNGTGPIFSHTEGRYIRLYIRTISTHEAHPGARVPVLYIYIPPNAEQGNFVRNIMLSLADDILSVFLSTVSPRLLLWNWKDGCLITDSLLSGHELPDNTLDFSFISPRAYILASHSGEGVIHIKSFVSSEKSRPIHAATLHLPALRGGVRVRSLTTHTGPFSGQPPHKPFTTASDSRIHALSVQYGPSGSIDSSPRYSIFLHNRTFLSYVESYASRTIFGELHIPWEDWGPRNTRFFPRYIPFTWLRYVHGQRVVCPPATDGVTWKLQVLDFNVYDSRLYRSTFGDVTKIIHKEASYVPGARTFTKDIITMLPYRQTICTILEDYSAFMIDEERIVGLKAEGVGDEELKELHIYTF